MKYGCSIIQLLMAASGLLGQGAVAAPTYHLVDLGTQGDMYAINQRAQVAGAVPSGRLEQAAKYRDGRWKVVPDLGHGSRAQGIDAHDDLIGRIYQKHGEVAAAIWPKHRDFVIIPLPYDSQFGWADGISPEGKVVVGTGFGSTFQPRCFSWPLSGTAVDLGTLGGDACIPNAVNDAGQIAGQSNLIAGQPTHAFLITGGVMRDLGTLAGGDFSYLSQVNAAGHGVGQSDLANGDRHGIFWNGNQLVDLGAGTYEATGLNDQDDMVGIGTDGTTTRDFLYRDGQLTFLDQLTDNGAGWTFDDAVYIDNGRVIVGIGVYQDHAHMFKLVPL